MNQWLPGKPYTALNCHRLNDICKVTLGECPCQITKNYNFLSCPPFLSTLQPIFFTLWSSIQRQWPVRITSCTRHSQNAGNFFSPINHQRELCNLKAKGCNFEISTAHKMKNLWAVDWSKNNKIKVSGFCIPLTYFLDAISEQSSELTVVWTQGKI